MADPFIQYAVAAGAMAMEDAGLVIEGELGERAGCFVGSGMGGVTTIETTHRALLAKGPRHAFSPFFVPQIAINLAAGQLSIRYGAKGPCYSQVSACSSGAHAIGDAFRVIQRGEADVMICGGSEAVVTPLGVGGFGAMRALSTRNDDAGPRLPSFRSRSRWLRARRGGGHPRPRGSGARATARRAHLCGMQGLRRQRRCPSHHRAGRRRARARSAACARRWRTPGSTGARIDYLNAHGTSTKMNDATETLAIKKVFGDHARKLMVSSTKSMTGHLLGAAGGVEAAFCALAVARGQVPPTINYTTPDPDCDLDYVPNTARDAQVRNALTNSFGFGGTNACLIFGELEA